MNWSIRNTASDNIAGGCQCGAIRYRLRVAPVVVYCCHCTHCQQQSSSAFGVSVWSREEDFTLLQGELAQRTVRADSGNIKVCAFCGQCGSRIYHQAQGDEGILSVKGGTLDNARDLKPAAHIWARSAHHWMSLQHPDMLVYDTEPDDFQEIIDHYNRNRGTATG